MEVKTKTQKLNVQKTQEKLRTKHNEIELLTKLSTGKQNPRVWGSGFSLRWLEMAVGASVNLDDGTGNVS